jgi:hypothetical protein
MVAALSEGLSEMKTEIRELLDRPVERTVERDKDGRPLRVTETRPPLRVVS